MARSGPGPQGRSRCQGRYRSAHVVIRTAVRSPDGNACAEGPLVAVPVAAGVAGTMVHASRLLSSAPRFRKGMASGSTRTPDDNLVNARSRTSEPTASGP